MKKRTSHTINMLVIVYLTIFGLYACDNNKLDIQQIYSFELVTMPVHKKIVEGKTVELQCELVKKGEYKQTEYTIRYFQSEGKGCLRFNQATLLENKRYPLKNNKFNLYYTSMCNEQQSFDIYIEDNFGQVIQKSFGFQNESKPEGKPISNNFTLTILPIPKQIPLNDTVEVICQLVKEDTRNNALYSIRYFQPEGKGLLIFQGNTPMKPNELYKLDSDVFKLFYVSNSKEYQAIDLYIIDNNGNTVKKTFGFEHLPTKPKPEIDKSFQLITLPVQHRIVKGETIEIRCKIKKADKNNQASYAIRYFQPDGKGILRMDDGTIFKPNDLYLLDRETFRLYYTSLSEGQHTIDVYVEDSFEQVVQKTFSWQNAITKDREKL